MSLTKVRNQMIDGAAVNVLDFGAVGDGVANDTVAIQAAINSGAATIKFAGLTYLVDIASLTMASNQTLDGEGATLISAATTVNKSLLTARDKTNITVKNFIFSTNNSQQCAALFLGCSQIIYENNQSINCCMITVGSSAQVADGLLDYYPIYASVNSGNQSSDISIRNNLGDGDGTFNVLNPAGINMAFAYDVKVEGNTVNAYQHGIQWWGGDADPSINGLIANERKVNTMNITSNVCTNIQGGGIWGSMGRSVIVADNEVDYSGDVGIDFEGCVDCIAIGNNVRNRVNGVLTIGFICQNIKFVSNIAKSDTDGVYMINLFGTVGGTYDNENLVFTDNEFIMDVNTGAVGVVGVVTNSTNLSIINNRFHNVRIDMNTTSFRNLIVEDNTFFMDWVHTTAFVAIACQSFTNTGANSTVSIRRNKVVASVTQTTAGSVGFYCTIGSSFGTDTYRLNVEDNDFSALFAGWFITATDTAANAANLKITVKRNYVSTATDPTLTLSAAGFATVWREDNMYKNAAGIDFGYPYQAPGAGKWFQGERSFTAAPASAGYIGYVCTATGIPGTWATYGLIS